MKRFIQAFILFLIGPSVLFFVYGFLKGPYAPAQPIEFSHKIHAGKYEMACLYCHSYANRSPYAGIPSVQRCMGCHKITAANKPEVKKIHEYWNKKEPIPWIKVYKLPDFAYFTHRRHVNNKINCKTCHGEVEKMERIQRVSSLKMGWCVKCHKENNASRDCLVCHK